MSLADAWEPATQLADELAMLVRFTRDLPSQLRRPIRLESAKQRLRRGLETRTPRFLALTQRTIFDNPASPYLKLLRHAGWEPDDLQRLVTQEGLTSALERLASAGVYVTFEELKGRREVVRGSLRFWPRDTDFDNPLAPRHFALYTSGSSGRPSRVRTSLQISRHIAESTALAFEAVGLREPRHVILLTAPIHRLLMYPMLGQRIIRWLYPVAPLPVQVRVGAYYLSFLGRIAGYQYPLPEHYDMHDMERMARWLADQQRDGPVAVACVVSAAARIAASAQALGIQLDRVTFAVQGEPLTEARRRLIAGAGSSLVPQYGGREAPTLAYGCTRPASADDVHLFDDRNLITTHTRPLDPAGDEGTLVEPLLLTSLTSYAPKVMFNAEMGDTARVEERECGCTLGALGLKTHLLEVRSFEKLTGEGATFARSTLLSLLEETLPRRFGGSSIDYQLAEEEHADSATRLILRVSPSVGPLDEAAVLATLLDELRNGGLSDRHQADLWRQAGTVTVRREAPRAGGGGRILPLQIRPQSEARAEREP